MLAEHRRPQCRAFSPVVVIVVGVVVASSAAAGDVVDRQVPCLFAGQQVFPAPLLSIPGLNYLGMIRHRLVRIAACLITRRDCRLWHRALAYPFGTPHGLCA